MKYLIVSKNEAAGTSTNDIANPLVVTEIATELIITRLYLLSQLSIGLVTKDDTVVCIEERKCLYTNIFPNVISWDRFKTLTLEETDERIDYLEGQLFHRLAGGDVSERIIPYLPFYQNYERDKDLINDVDFVSIDPNKTDKPFVCLVVRKRGAWPEKNMTDEFWSAVIEKLSSNNIPTFIFGKETKSFCKYDNTYYVSNYQEWCSIVSHPNCKHVGSTMTGGVYPLLIFGNEGSKMTIIDNTNLMSAYSYDPSFYNSCINFSKVDIQFINKIPTVDEYYERLVSNL